MGIWYLELGWLRFYGLIVHGRWSMDHGQGTIHFPLSTLNYPLSIIHYPLFTPHKPRFPFQRFHHIVYNGAGAVVHDHTKDTVYKSGLVQVGEIAAIGKALLINGAFVIAKKHTGHVGHDGIATDALGKVFCFGLGRRQVEMRCKKKPLWGGNADHQGFTAIAALGTIDLWGNGII